MSKRRHENKMPLSLEIGKLPPQNVDMEEAILGALMLEKEAITKAGSILKPEVFYKEEHQKIYAAIEYLFVKGKAIDIMTVMEQLRKNKELETIGGPAYLSQLTDRIASGAHIEEHSYIVKQKWLARELIRISTEVQNRAFDESIDIDDLLGFNQSELYKVLNSVLTGQYEHIGDIGTRELKHLSELEKSEKGITGVPSGYTKLDRVTGGWQNTDLVIIGARPSMGKGERLDENILTNSGWVKNKDLKIGMQVASIDGKYSEVTGLFPRGKIQFYKIKFSDGREIECDESHLWEVHSTRFYKGKPRVLSMIQIADKLKAKRYHRRMSIPYFSGEYGIKKKFTIHPYILGVLLSDGCVSTGLKWNKPDIFIADKIQKYLPKTHKVNHIKYNYYSIVCNNNQYKLLNEAKSLGIIGCRAWEKRIPDKYFHSSRRQRLELINGLLDTDGSVDKNGAIEYSTSSKQLAEDFKQLAYSLGYRCSMISRTGKLNGVEKRENYRLYISGKPTQELFTLPRKRDKIKNNRYQPLTIVSVEKTRIYESQCISVSHPRSLYITKDYLVTHNTALSLKFTTNAAKHKYKVGFFSLEMNKQSLYRRMLSSETGIENGKFRSGELDEGDWNKIDYAQTHFEEMGIYIDDTPRISVVDFKAKAISMKQKHKIDLIIIDYLQLMRAPGIREREREIAEISASLKAVAKEIEVPVIALAQLSREVEKRAGDKRPQLSDLRESGSLEQDADIVAFIHRPEYYGITENHDGMSTIQLIEFIIAKHRNGPLADFSFWRSRNWSDIEERLDVRDEIEEEQDAGNRNYPDGRAAAANDDLTPDDTDTPF